VPNLHCEVARHFIVHPHARSSATERAGDYVVEFDGLHSTVKVPALEDARLGNVGKRIASAELLGAPTFNIIIAAPSQNVSETRTKGSSQTSSIPVQRNAGTHTLSKPENPQKSP
jgi:hypothetical protein